MTKSILILVFAVLFAHPNSSIAQNEKPNRPYFGLEFNTSINFKRGILDVLAISPRAFLEINRHKAALGPEINSQPFVQYLEPEYKLNGFNAMYTFKVLYRKDCSLGISYAASYYRNKGETAEVSPINHPDGTSAGHLLLVTGASHNMFNRIGITGELHPLENLVMACGVYHGFKSQWTKINDPYDAVSDQYSTKTGLSLSVQFSLGFRI